MTTRRRSMYVRTLVLEIAAESAESADQLAEFPAWTLPDSDYGSRTISHAHAQAGDDDPARRRSP